MAVYVRIVDGDVESVGPLPEIAIRLDTGHRVDPRTRLKACGYHDVETFTPADVPPEATPQQRQVILTAVAEAKDRHHRRIDFVTVLRPSLETARDWDWAWLQKYSAVQFEGGSDPGAGAGWTQTPPASRLEVLRTAVSWAMFGQVELMRLADMTGRLLRQVFADTDLEPPGEPEPPEPQLLPADVP